MRCSSLGSDDERFDLNTFHVGPRGHWITSLERMVVLSFFLMRFRLLAADDADGILISPRCAVSMVVAVADAAGILHIPIPIIVTIIISRRRWNPCHIPFITIHIHIL